MIVWINGTFGVGKTTTATRLVEMSDRLRIFDAEVVGQLVARSLPDHAVSDFQDLPPWRALVPLVADELARFTGQHLVSVQSVLNEKYWSELRRGLAARGHDVFHVVLDADRATLHTRIDADPDGVEIRRWRHAHVAAYEAARPWLVAASHLVVDTSAAESTQIAARVHDAINLAISA